MADHPLINVPMTKQSAVAVLKALRAAGHRGATNEELLRTPNVPSRYSARIEELRSVGCDIRAEKIGRWQWRFTLLHEPDGLLPAPKAAHPAPAAVAAAPVAQLELEHVEVGHAA